MIRTIIPFPKGVRCIETCWIELTDGTRVAATIWLPVDAKQYPVPTILEYLPYHRRDGTMPRGRQMHCYFAGHDYAAVRVDIRGSGDSDRALDDEYLPPEQIDAVEVDRLALRSSMVRWQRRDDGYLLGQFQRIADCQSPPGGTQGDPRSVHDR
jgi:hypothetical protein